MKAAYCLLKNAFIYTDRRNKVKQTEVKIYKFDLYDIYK